jgi:Carboxypeptidase regulatory-like domain
MKRLFLLLIALACLTIFSNRVLACQCVESALPVCAAYWRSDAVFVGHLRDITPPDRKSTNSLPVATLHFMVEQPFRGITTAEVDVGTLSGTSCDAEYVKGIRYLIYAERDAESNQLFAQPCSRTTELRHAVDDLNYIRSLMQQGVTESLAGRVARYKHEPVSGVKIEVRNNSRSFETTTDGKGEFSVSLAGPGTYTVRVLVPSSVSVLKTREDQISKLEVTDALTTIEYEVELRKSECDYREFDLFPVDLHATAVVSGSVLTASGRPVSKGRVYLLKDGADSNRFNSRRIEANGSFKFDGVGVGEYFLALNPDNEAPDESDPPYPRSLYPNATEESGATKIVVTEGAKLENLILRVGPAWKARAVSGRVVWQEGGPAPSAHVSLYDGDRYIRRVKLDKKGWFNFKVYGDFKYAIEAQVDGQRQGKSDRVALTVKSTNLTLVIKP